MMRNQTMITQSVDAYQQLNEIEHILHRPDMYVSSLTRTPRIAKCLDFTQMKLVQKQISLSDAQEQIYIEIVANAADNVQESRELNIDPGIIEVSMNNEWFVVKN